MVRRRFEEGGEGERVREMGWGIGNGFRERVGTLGEGSGRRKEAGCRMMGHSGRVWRCESLHIESQFRRLDDAYSVFAGNTLLRTEKQLPFNTPRPRLVERT